MCSLLVKSIFFCTHYEFPSILILSSVKSAFTFFIIDLYIMTLQILSGCLTISAIHVEFWKQAQKKPTVSTNQMFILRLLLTAIITELRMFASYPYDISSLRHLLLLLCLMDLIILATMYLESPNFASSYKESLNV